uniref:Uncharacterized protein n=1 Tax=Fagus sylvatica TaxID=28930 RepID=A0A2N9IC46_FAGSY
MSNTSSWRTSTSERLKQTDISKVALADSGGGRGCCVREMTAGAFCARETKGREVSGEGDQAWGGRGLCEERVGVMLTRGSG